MGEGRKDLVTERNHKTSPKAESNFEFQQRVMKTLDSLERRMEKDRLERRVEKDRLERRMEKLEDNFEKNMEKLADSLEHNITSLRQDISDIHTTMYDVTRRLRRVEDSRSQAGLMDAILAENFMTRDIPPSPVRRPSETSLSVKRIDWRNERPYRR
jgi:septal ring factor EnvC (AmiA/AmiB activator)